MASYIVEFDYTAKSADELTIRKGDIVTDAVPAEDGWLKGECRGVLGLFPDNFVTLLKKEKAKARTFATGQSANKSDTLRKRSLTMTDAPSQNGILFQVRAVYTYLPLHDDELSIKPNDVINVTRMVEEGWYEGKLNGKLGLFPSNYVTRIHDDLKSKAKPKQVNGLSELVKNEASKKSSLVKARVLYDYKATAEDELSLSANDIVTVLDKHLEDEGWWKGEINGRVGVFPDNYVEEIPSSTALKQRASAPEHQPKQPARVLAKATSTNGASYNYVNEPPHPGKSTSISDDEGHLSRNRQANNHDYDAREKHKSSTTKRPPSTTVRRTEHDSNKIPEETNQLHSSDNKNEHKMHTPSPPSFQREPGQLESPRYTNRSHSLTNTSQPLLNGTSDSLNSSYAPAGTVDQMQKELLKLKSSMEEVKSHFTTQMRDLITELDEEKKARATLQIEIERLQKLVQKTSLGSS